jgi:hypothetical protein
VDGDRKPADREPDKAEKPLGRDERVSFYPMDPEEVLRKLLRSSGGPGPGSAEGRGRGLKPSKVAHQEPFDVAVLIRHDRIWVW